MTIKLADGYLQNAQYGRPYGRIVDGMYETYILANGNWQPYDDKLFEAIDTFLNQYQNKLPRWNQWIVEWHMSVGVEEYFDVEPYDSPVVQGFYLDFGEAMDPPWIAPSDIPHHVPGFNPLLLRALFWRAFDRFINTFETKGAVTLSALCASWKEFLRVTATIHIQAAENGRYRYYQMESFEQCWQQARQQKDLQTFHKDFRTFIDYHLEEVGYFLPSHHLDGWKRWL